MHILLLLCCCISVIQGLNQADDLDSVINELKGKIAQSQIVNQPGKHDIMKKQFGVYPSYIRSNFAGTREAELLRVIGIFDNNAFVTLWVSSVLLETARFQKGPPPSDDQLLRALQAIQTYHDKNYLERGVLIFWPQQYNETSREWFCGPENLEPQTEEFEKMMKELYKILDDLGLEKFWEEVFEGIFEELSTGAAAFPVPADFDDTFVNLGFGSLLSTYAKTSSGPYQTWKKNNPNITHIVDALKKYAYRPLSDEVDSSLIDARTFLILREYLYEIEQNHQSAAFITTWVQNLTEAKQACKKHYCMPFYVNNVDLTVGTNVIYGLTSAVLSNLDNPSEWFDPEVQMIYENTTNLLVWAIERNFSGRPDIALTYYPSVFNFYWFTSRTLNLLQSFKSRSGDLPFPVMSSVMERLSKVLRTTVTNTLVKEAASDDNGETLYFDDFLGNDDMSIFGKRENHGEDRIVSTAMAVNTLLYTWMDGDKFLPTTPSSVLKTVMNGTEWLVRNALSGKYKPLNVLFSGSVKTADDLPFYYPVNYMKYLNGSSLPSHLNDSAVEVVLGVKGIIPKESYNEMLKQNHFGRPTPIEFHGYNKYGSWPFWSAEPFTYSAAMLALTQYRALLESGQLFL